MSISSVSSEYIGKILWNKRDWISVITFYFYGRLPRETVQLTSKQTLQFDVKRSVKTDRKRCWQEIADHVETAGDDAKSSNSYSYLEKARLNTCIIRNASGRAIPECQRKIQRWVEQFSQFHSDDTIWSMCVTSDDIINLKLISSPMRSRNLS